MLTFTNRIEALRLATTPTPLWVYLLLYHKAQHECYINYMQGAKDLYNYLAPINLTDISHKEIPSFFRTYESKQLTYILVTSESKYDLKAINKVECAIIHTSLDLHNKGWI